MKVRITMCKDTENISIEGNCAVYEECESRLNVGYQGVKGSYSHEALLEYFHDDIDAMNTNEFEDVFQLLQQGKVKYGVLPIENSSTGGISEVIDLLYKYDVYIVGEKCIEINHNLLGIDGATLEDIEEVYSHPQAFQQSKEFFKEHPKWKLISYFNTAKSVEFIKDKQSRKFAAVASKKAADIYGAEIIEEHINYNKYNYTRFIIISNKFESDASNNKISIVISLAHSCGALFQVIKCIADHNLNMLKIESRPIIGEPWQYLFYIDFEGNIDSADVNEALLEIKDSSIHFKFLGNYKADWCK